jgi:hypothetical protein
MQGWGIGSQNRLAHVHTFYLVSVLKGTSSLFHPSAAGGHLKASVRLFPLLSVSSFLEVGMPKATCPKSVFPPAQEETWILSHFSQLPAATPPQLSGSFSSSFL